MLESHTTINDNSYGVVLVVIIVAIVAPLVMIGVMLSSYKLIVDRGVGLA